MLVITRATEINAGAYSCVAINSSGTATSSAATLAVVSTMNAGRLVNLSVRAITGAEGQTPIVGFVIGGPGTSGSQNLLIRAAGPTLNGLGATGVLADPILTVLQGGAVVAANDNWGTPASNQSAVLAAVSATGAFQFSSASSLDAALVANLPSVTGGYTAEITGAGRGVTLAEVYDNTALYAATTPRLINLSARTQVGAGVGDLIAGFVIGGSTSKTVLIRAVGPALVSRGVTTALPDPQVALHAMINGQDMALATNAGWGGDAQISVVGNSVGAFPLANGSTADSALLLSLPPGAYTVHVSSVSGDTGIALAEIYEVP
jgi:hypothetical protein